MKYHSFKCPLCCKKAFSSKEELIEHLKSYKIACSICNEEFLSIAALNIHLNSTYCENSNNANLNNKNETQDPLYDVNQSVTEESYKESTSIGEKSNCFEGESNLNEDNKQDPIVFDQHANSDHIYSLLSNSEEQTYTKDIESSISQYVIVNHDGTPAIVSGDKIITTQNVDGSILFNLGEKYVDPSTKTDPDPVITMTNKEQDLENPDEVYNCNTCNISFTSVLEHIKNYHNDQDVVVEVSENMVLNDSDGLNTSQIDEDLPQFQTMKRIITDTGDIVDAKEQENQLHIKNEREDNRIEPNKKENEDKNIISLVEHVKDLVENVEDKKGRAFKRKTVKTQTSNSGVTNIINTYHQVIMKDMITLDSEGDQQMRVYTCTNCNLYVGNLEQFSSLPCKQKSESNIWSCTQCDAVFRTVKGLNSHMREHKGMPKKNLGKRNKIINKDGSNQEISEIISQNMEKEIAEIPNPEEEMFTCDICSTEFVTNKSLKLHRRMHDPIKTRPIEPPVDGVIDEDFFCANCNKMIPIGYRKVHEDYHMHEDYNCDRCNKKFTSRLYLTMHMGVHNNDKVAVKESDKTLPYMCAFCDRRFARPHEKVKHERIHTGEKPHSCEICGKSFRVSYCLTLHMRTHTGARPYECHFCGKRFKAHSVYNHHLLTHSDVRAYKCPYCPKAFKTAVQLAGHKNSHTKPFSCDTCNRPFASLYAVRVHSETHNRNNSLKFSCKLCGASYARTFALKDHMKQVHNEMDFNTTNSDVRENNVVKVIRGNSGPETIIISEGIS